MAATRALFLLLLVASALLFLFFAATGQVRYKKWGLALFKWTLLTGLGFFAVLIFQRFS